MSMKLYRFDVNLGIGSLTGLFVEEEARVTAAIGMSLDFWDIFHVGREITYTLREGDLQVKSSDERFIDTLIDAADGWDIGGTNPLHYVTAWKDGERPAPSKLMRLQAVARRVEDAVFNHVENPTDDRRAVLLDAIEEMEPLLE